MALYLAVGIFGRYAIRQFGRFEIHGACSSQIAKLWIEADRNKFGAQKNFAVGTSNVMQPEPKFFAHSTLNADQSDWQSLGAHLEAVAERAGRFGARLGISELARLAGQLHDIGKFDPLFQRRLTDQTIRVEHSLAGAWVALNRNTRVPSVFRDLIAHAVAGHHAGLPDRRGSAASLETRLSGFDPDALDPAWEKASNPDAFNTGISFSAAPDLAPAFRIALLGRMIFSCLVDADFLDTEAFYDGILGRRRERIQLEIAACLPDMIARFDGHMTDLLEGRHGKSRPIDSLRTEILQVVLSRASESPGLFTLTVPTGGGKTLASLGFALRHAATHGLDRIIYACPYTSIIDQTAEIFRNILGSEFVLEHHSAIDEETLIERGQQEKLKLAMEDWSAPIVVTTNVQIFESLFAARPSRCRKVHNIARSVIILDEAQSLPRPLLVPSLMALETLATDWGCSIVLCTATQPAQDRGMRANGRLATLPISGRELAPNPSALAAQLKRTTLRFHGQMSDEDLVAALRGSEQGLVIVNSRAHALSLYRSAKATGLDGLIHLTTRQCATDRRSLLALIRAALLGDRPCRVIATSLVEAGVDLDFPRVWRAAAGLDQIAQAAGRCNREGRRLIEESVVTVFDPIGHPAPVEIRNLADDAKRAIDQLVEEGIDLFSPEGLDRYFNEVYWRLGNDLDRYQIVLGNNPLLKMAKTSTDLAFRTVAERFRMIEAGLEPVVVGADTVARDAIELLSFSDVRSGTIARRLQPYIVLVPPRARRLLIENKHVAFEAPELRGEQFAVLRTESLYSLETGLLWEDAAYLGAENVII